MDVNIITMPMDWGSLFIGIGSLILSLVAIIISIMTFRHQHKHDLNSVRPILEIIPGDYEDDIYVELINVGVGPATIQSLRCFYNGSIKVKNRECKTLIELLSVEGFPSQRYPNYSTFIEKLDGRTIQQEKSLKLIRKKGNLSDPEKAALRLVLMDVTIEVHYTDIYGTKFTVINKLNFFGRHFPNLHPESKLFYSLNSNCGD